jgi:hypothetical protein
MFAHLGEGDDAKRREMGINLDDELLLLLG